MSQCSCFHWELHSTHIISGQTQVQGPCAHHVTADALLRDALVALNEMWNGRYADARPILSRAAELEIVPKES